MPKGCDFFWQCFLAIQCYQPFHSLSVGLLLAFVRQCESTVRQQVGLDAVTELFKVCWAQILVKTGERATEAMAIGGVSHQLATDSDMDYQVALMACTWPTHESICHKLVGAAHCLEERLAAARLVATPSPVRTWMTLRAGFSPSRFCNAALIVYSTTLRWTRPWLFGFVQLSPTQTSRCSREKILRKACRLNSPPHRGWGKECLSYRAESA